MVLINDAFKPPNNKTNFSFALICMWNVQIQILDRQHKKMELDLYVHSTLSYFGSIIAKNVAKNMIEFEIFDHT